MRIENVWDKWMTYDVDGFVNGIRSDAPEDVKKAYAEYMAELEQQAKSGCVFK